MPWRASGGAGSQAVALAVVLEPRGVGEEDEMRGGWARDVCLCFVADLYRSLFVCMCSRGKIIL